MCPGGTSGRVAGDHDLLGVILCSLVALDYVFEKRNQIKPVPSVYKFCFTKQGCSNAQPRPRTRTVGRVDTLVNLAASYRSVFLFLIKSPLPPPTHPRFLSAFHLLLSIGPTLQSKP